MKNKKVRFKNNNNLLILLEIIGVLLIFVIGNSFFNFYSGNVIKNSINNLNNETNVKAEKIDKFLINSGNEILFLSRLPSLHNLINSQRENLREQFKLDLQNDFLDFSKQKKIYYQMRYIDETGQEIVRIDSDGKFSKIISEDKLQNKKERYYFQDAIRLDKSEVFISPLDLNIENGKIESKNTNENLTYITVIRYATPIFDDFENSKGIMVINIYTNNFLEEIQKNNFLGNTFLINGKGFYLSNKNKSKEFEFMFNKTSSFFKDYPEKITTALLANKGQIFLETKNLVFSFKYIYPAFMNLKINQGGKINFQGVPIENHYWVLVTVLPKNKIGYLREKNKK